MPLNNLSKILTDQDVWTVLLALGLAAGVSFASTPLVKALSVKVGAVDVPKDERRMHHHPIPRMGGLAIFFGFVAAMLLMVPLDTERKGMLLGAVIIVVLGIFDDIYALPAKPKFLSMESATVWMEATTSSRLSAVSFAMPFPSRTASEERSMSAEVFFAALADLPARVRTSSATTAKPLPASPALAASTAAFRDRILVWNAMSSIDRKSVV